MKKIFYPFILCLFSSINLFCQCDYDDDYFYNEVESYSVHMEGVEDTIIIIMNQTYLFLPSYREDMDWTIAGATDYDWHGADVQKLALTPTPENHDSIDGGWFQAKKVGESNDWSGLFVKVEPNTTGKNRYAEVNLYHEKASSSAVVKIYQDSK